MVVLWKTVVVLFAVALLAAPSSVDRGQSGSVTLGQVLFFMALCFFGLCAAVKEAGETVAEAVREAGRPVPPPAPRAKAEDATRA